MIKILGAGIILLYFGISPFVPLNSRFENQACRFQLSQDQTRVPEGTSGTLRMAIERRDASVPARRRTVDCQWTQLLFLRLNPINRIQSF
jgi:hypothetical protein